MVKKDSENFYAKYLRISLPFLILILLSFSVFAITTQDANYSSGVYNGGFEYGTGEGLTTSSWIGDINYGWYRNGTGTFGTVFLGFDNTRFKSGLQSMKLDFNEFDSGEAAYFNNGRYPGATLDYRGSQQTIKIKPSTNYKLSFWVNVNALNWTQLIGTKQPTPVCLLTQYNSAGTRLNNISILARTLTTTGGSFVYLEDFGVTEATASIGVLSCGVQTSVESGTFSDGNGVVWFDDVRLEEVGSVNLSGQLQGRPSIVVTSVSDFNAIDQAQTNSSFNQSLGSETKIKFAQQILPTKRNNKLTFKKGITSSDFNQNVTITITDNNADNPSNNIFFTKVYSASDWNNLPTDLDTTIDIDLNTFDVNGTNKFWVVWSVDLNYSDSNTSLRRDTGANYSSGLCKEFNPITQTWGIVGADAYFITYFEKQSSAFDLNVCSSGDSVCESKTYNISDLNDGETYTISPSDAPLFYSGDNNVYFMMHSDSDFNNKTPSMMAKLTYTFDKPTTTLTRTKHPTEPTTDVITLTCTNDTFGSCLTTYYNTGSGYQEYIQPFNLKAGTYTIQYYSIDNADNRENTNTAIIRVNDLSQNVQVVTIPFFYLAFILIFASMVMFTVNEMFFKFEIINQLLLIVGAGALILLFASLL